jgi:uncharacterized repeat protein (TIGR03809 family)
MAEGIRSAFAVDLTRKWRALAERRKAHLVDLYNSGRWRLYYSEQEFVLRLREAIRNVEKWGATERSAACEAAALPISSAGEASGTSLGDADEEVASVAQAVDGPDLRDADEEGAAAEDAIRERESA